MLITSVMLLLVTGIKSKAEHYNNFVTSTLLDKYITSADMVLYY